MPVPTRLGQFELREEIGRGGIATVYRAVDRVRKCEVTLKLLREELAQDPGLVGDFLEEARHVATLNHPRIRQVYEAGEADGRYYIAMELLNGRALDKLIEKERWLDEEPALQIAIDVAEALQAAYRQRIIHGDVKPPNIFVVEGDGAKLLDFGMARLTNIGSWSSDGIWGSPHYVSPERVQQLTENFCSDVYSLGVTLFHALTGRPPFEGSDAGAIALKRLTEKPPGVRELNPRISAATEQVISKMLHRNPGQRYSSYDDLLEALRHARPRPLRRPWRSSR
jgi:serine/threonine protein kinase